MNNSGQHHGYAFAGFSLDLDRAALFLDGADLHLRPQVFDVLRYLVERSGSLVTKEELLAAIWGDKAVTDDSLTHCIIEIRKALDDADRRIVRTVPRRGFVFDAPVRRLAPPAANNPYRAKRVRPLHLAALFVLAAAASYAFLARDAANDPSDAVVATFNEYLEQAQFVFQRRAAGDLDTALEYFEQAIELQPNSAEAWAGLAGVYRILALEGPAEEEYLAKLKTAAETAVRLDPENGAAWMRLAHFYHASGEGEARERAYAEALAADPGDPLVLASTAGRLARLGDLQTAIELNRRAVELEPLSFVNRSNLSIFLLAAGDYEAAMQESKRAFQMRPATAERQDVVTSFALLKLGQYQDALAFVRDWPLGPDRLAVTAMASHALGRDAESTAAVNRLMNSPGGDGLFRLAEVEAFCCAADRSLEHLTEARRHFAGVSSTDEIDYWLFSISLSPFLAAVREDPRWDDWVRQTRDLARAEQVAGVKL